MNPKEYLQSLAPGMDADLVHKYDGGEVRFRTFLTTDECQVLPIEFFKATRLAQNNILFGLLARASNGMELFPRMFGLQVDNVEESERLTKEFGALDGLALHQIANDVGLVDVIWEKLNSRSYLPPKVEDENEEGE